MLWVLNPSKSSRLLEFFCEVAVGVGSCGSEQQSAPPLRTMDLHSSQHTLLLYEVHLSEFCLGIAEITRNDVCHKNLVKLGVDVECVVVHRFPILLFNGAETHENPRPTARIKYKRQVPPTNASSAWCLSSFVI